DARTRQRGARGAAVAPHHPRQGDGRAARSRDGRAEGGASCACVPAGRHRRRWDGRDGRGARMIPDHLIDEVRDRADIVEMIGELIPLKRAGKDFRALCPFHHEKTPSFYVVPSKGFFKCFGCGESGDVFSFLMKHQGLSFTDAVRQVADRVGVEIPRWEGPRQEEDPNRKLYEAISFAADFFERMLREPAGEHALRYLQKREIGEDAIKRFRIGYAPDDWQALRGAAHQHGIEDDVLLDAGLIKESERGSEPYDRFRNRLMFAVAEVSGRVIAFGGRVLTSGDQPKYLNSPETPIFHKGTVLYGLNWSRNAIRREGAALVVEGYMDYVALAGRGIENVVAGMGTAMTPEQANLLARYAGRALLLYDSDTAGGRASWGVTWPGWRSRVEARGTGWPAWAPR